MISGKLPNDTVWWLSTNGKKIWIESKDLEQEKFKEKEFNIINDRILYAQKEVFYSAQEAGELTTSRLESRKRQDAWVINVDAMLTVYPELIEEIKRKEIEEKKKKKPGVSSKKGREKRREFEANYTKEVYKYESLGKDESSESDNSHIKKPVGDYFSVDRPYVIWIKDELEKSEKGELIISFKDLKSKMGEDFEKMDDFRIFFGLNKILSSIGMVLESKIIKRESMALIKKINKIQ